jgi:hypothetical protein
MEMSRTLNPRKSPSESLVLSRLSGAAIHTHPDDIVNDPELSVAEKRAVLASWISDARAVENAPSLRRLDSGAVVEVDAILQALDSLDQHATSLTEHRKWQPPLGRRHRAISRLLRRIGPALRLGDDDDDPPPAPAALGIPFRTAFVAAHGERSESGLGLACAIGR